MKELIPKDSGRTRRSKAKTVKRFAMIEQNLDELTDVEAENRLSTAEVEELIASVNQSTPLPKKKKINSLAVKPTDAEMQKKKINNPAVIQSELLKPTDAEINAQLKAENVELHLKNRRLEAENKKLLLRNQKFETKLNFLKQNAPYRLMAHQLQDRVKSLRATLHGQQQEISRYDMQLYRVLRENRSVSKQLLRLRNLRRC